MEELNITEPQADVQAETQVEQQPSTDNVTSYFNDVIKPSGDFATETEFRDFISDKGQAESYFKDVVGPAGDFGSFEEFSSFLNIGGVGKTQPPIQTNIGGAEQKPTTLKPATQSPLKSSGIQSLSERLIKTPSSYYTQKITEEITLPQARYVVSSLGYSMNDISNKELTDVLANKESYRSLGHMVDDVKGRIAQNRQRQAEEPVQPEEGRVTKTTKTVLGKEVKKEPMVMAPKDPFGFESVIKEVESPERPKSSLLQSYDNNQQETIDAEREMLWRKSLLDNPIDQRTGQIKTDDVRRQEQAAYERYKKDYDRLKQRSSKSLEEAKPIIDQYADALTDGVKWQSFKNKEGFFDAYKANDAAKKIAAQNGFSDNGPAVKYIEGQIISKAQFKEKQPEIEARYAERQQEILGTLEADQAKVEEEFKGVSKTLAETNLQIESLATEVSALIATEADPIRKDYELSTSDIKTGYDALDKDLQNQLSQNAQLYNSGQITFEQATQNEQQLNAQREELLNQTNIELGNQFDLLTARLNEVNSKYKQRYERQKNEIASAAEAKFQQEFQQFAKDKNLTEDAMIKLKAAYKDAYDATMLADKEKRQAFEKEIGDDIFRVPQLGKFVSALFSQDDSVFNILDFEYLLPINTDLFKVSYNNSLGNALESLGNEMGLEALRIGGRQMALSSDLLAPKEKISWGDLTDWISFQKSAGNLAGSMTPSLVATAAATTITGGLGLGTIGTMTIGGLVGWQTESMQMASQVYLDTLKETGDAVLAQRRADKMWDFQKSIILSYGLEALPFIGVLKKGTSQIGRRIALGAAAELGTEAVFQEFPQTVAEEAIMKDQDAMKAVGSAYKGVAGYLANRVAGDAPTEQEVKDYQLFKRVVIETAPVAILGGGGQAISSLREQRVINAAEKIGKEYMQKAVYGSVSPVQSNQFLSRLVSAKGVDFATTMVTGLFTSGQITEVEKNKMLEGISKSETIISTAKRQKMNRTEESVFSFLNFLNDDLARQVEEETDVNVKAALEAKQKSIETDLKNFLITKKSDLFVIEYANGSEALMTPDDITTLSQNQAFINDLRDGSLSIKGLSAEFTSKQKPIIDDLNARMEASKEAAPEAGLTVEEIKQGFQEQLDNVDLSSPKAGQITSDIILDYIVAGNADSVEAAIDSGKPIDGKEASMLLDSLYTALARVDESVSMTAEQKADLQGILEPLISKIEGYDNITEGTTIKVTERQATARPVEDARKVKDQASAIENSRGKKGVLIRPSRRNPNQRVKENVRSIDPATIPIESEVSIVRDDAGEIVGYSFTLPYGNELFVDDPGGGIDLALMQKNEIMGAPPQLMEQVFEDVMREVEVTAPTTKTETTKPTENAVQEQAAGQVPVQPEAGVSETMAEGKPETEPQVTPTEGQAEQAKAPTEEKKEVNVGDALNIINALNEQTPGQTEEAPRTYTTKNIDRAINDARKAKDAKLEKALVDAKAIMKALGKKDTKVVIHFNQGSYTQSVVQAGGEAQAFGTSGFVISKDGNTIHLNLPKIKSNEVVLHEGAHPVLDWITKNNPERIDALYTELESLAQVLPGVNDAIAFSKKYGNTTQAKKEAIVQFMALVADGTINLSEANPTFKQKAIEFIKKLLQAIGIDFGVKISDDASVTELAKRFTESVKYGREISVASKTGVATPQMMIAGVNAELAQDVRDNLQVARDMEAANKDAKTIRIATGWEKGVDGLWRYEVPDNIPYLKDTVRQVKQYLFEDEGVDDIGQKASYFLPPELIKLYPKLDEVLIFFNKRGDENVGSYDELAKIINVNIGVYPEKTVSVLLHEIQHAIQDIEGFDKGASPKDLLGTFVLKEQALLDRIKKLEGPRGGNNPTAIENAKQDYRDFVKKFGTIKDGKKILYALDLYNRKAGEVEARNVEARMKMTPEQRRATTLQETEDVARDSQIFLREGDMTTGPQFSMTEGGRVTAEDIYPGTAFEMQDAAAEDTVGRNKDNWGASQVWRERIENAGDILRELSGRVNPDPVYILEKLNKLKNWIEQGKKNPTDKIPTYINTLDDFNKTNLRFTNIVDGYEYLTKFNSDVLEKVKREYNAIHTYTKEQRLALDLVIDLLENNINGVENKISSLEKIVEKAKQDKKLDQTVDIKLGSTTGPQFSMAGGVPISDVITALRNAGATEQVIADALKQSGYYTQEEINDAMGLPAPKGPSMPTDIGVPPPISGPIREGAKTNIAAAYKRIAEKAKSEGEIDFADEIREAGLYEQKTEEQTKEAGQLLVDAFNGDVDAAADFVKSQPVNGALRTWVLGLQLRSAVDKAVADKTIDNQKAVRDLISAYTLFQIDTGQTVNAFKYVIELIPELFYDAKVAELIAKAGSGLGDPNITNTKANQVRNASEAVAKLRKDILNQVANVIAQVADDATIDRLMTDALNMNKAGSRRVLTDKMRSGLKKIAGSVESKTIITNFIKGIAEKGIFGLAETREEVKDLIQRGLAEINPTLQTPLDTAEIQEMADLFLQIYEEMAQDKLDQELTRVFNGNSNNNAAIIKAVMYGALNDQDSINKFGQKFGLPYLTPAMQAQLKAAAQAYVNAQGNLAKQQAMANFTSVFNQAAYQSASKAKKFWISLKSVLDSFDWVFYNTALTAISTFMRAAQGNITRTFGNVLQAIANGDIQIVSRAFQDVYKQKKLNVNIKDANGNIVNLNYRSRLFFDDIYSSLRGLPRLAEVKRAGLSAAELAILNAPNTTLGKVQKFFLRAFAVPASRIMAAIDAMVMPLNNFMTKRQAFYYQLKDFYKAKGIDISHKRLMVQVDHIMGIQKNYVSAAMQQAYLDTINSKLWNDLGFTNPSQFPFADPRVKNKTATKESKIYNLWLFRVREILDEQESKRLQDSFALGNNTNLMLPAESELVSAAIDKFASRTSSELAYMGVPRGSMGVIADVLNNSILAKIEGAGRVARYANLLPLFVNAATTGAGMLIKVSPGINIIQYAHYRITGRRGAIQTFLGKKQDEFGLETSVKIDKDKMFRIVVLTNALTALALMFRPYDDDEEEKTAIDNKDWIGVTPLRITPAQQKAGYLPGRIYVGKGKNYDYADHPLAGLFSSIAFLRNYDLWSFDDKSSDFYVEKNEEIGINPTIAEHVQAYGAYLLNSVMSLSTIKDMATTWSNIFEWASTLNQKDSPYAEKATTKLLEKNGASFIRTSIPYSRFVNEMKAITDAFYGEDKKLALDFMDKIVFGSALEDNVINTNGYDFFGRPVKDVYKVITPIISSYTLGEATIDDKYLSLYRDKNFTPKLLLNDFIPVHVSIDDLNDPSMDKLNELYDVARTEMKAKEPKIKDVSKSTYPNAMVLVDLALTKEQANLANELACRFVGIFVERNYENLKKMDRTRFKAAMTSLYNIGHDVAIYQNMPELTEFDREDMYSAYSNKIEKFLGEFISTTKDQLEWPTQFDASNLLGGSYEQRDLPASGLLINMKPIKEATTK